MVSTISISGISVVSTVVSTVSSISETVSVTVSTAVVSVVSISSGISLGFSISGGFGISGPLAEVTVSVVSKTISESITAIAIVSTVSLGTGVQDCGIGFGLRLSHNSGNS